MTVIAFVVIVFKLPLEQFVVEKILGNVVTSASKINLVENINSLRFSRRKFQTFVAGIHFAFNF